MPCTHTNTYIDAIGSDLLLKQIHANTYPLSIQNLTADIICFITVHLKSHFENQFINNTFFVNPRVMNIVFKDIIMHYTYYLSFV